MELVGAPGRDLDSLLAAPRAPSPILFLPFLQGERVPYWNPALRGAFLWLHRHHGPTDLAYAVLEGIAFLNKAVLDRAESAIGRPISEIRFGGGGAANKVWRQIKADVLGRPVLVGEALVRMARRHEPGGRNYRDLYGAWVAAVEATRHVVEKVGGMNSPVSG